MSTVSIVEHGLLPTWVEGAMASSTVLVVCATERQRQQHLRALAARDATADTTRIVTLPRLARLLRQDLGLPEIERDRPLLTLRLDLACRRLASEGAFPLLHSAWHVGRTERLERLHARLAEEDLLDTAWDDDPGVDAFRVAVREVEESTGRMHPSVLPSRVAEALEHSSDVPFTLGPVQGVLVLPHPPQMEGSWQRLLRAVDAVRPVHVLRTPGNLRTGFGGGWVDDVAPCGVEGWPAWLPDGAAADVPGTSWDVLDAHVERVHRVVLQRRSHGTMAAVDLALRTLRKEPTSRILIVDADAARRSAITRSLEAHGLTVDGDPPPSLSRAVAGVLRLAEAGLGPEAWNVERLLDLAGGASLGFSLSSEGLVPQHPSGLLAEPDVALLRDVARSAHLRGGPGALQRWRRVVEGWRPNAHRGSVESQLQRIESTAWWLACVQRLWSPLLTDSDREGTEPLTGPWSGRPLPLPEAPGSLASWLDVLLQGADWPAISERRPPFDHSLASLHHLVEAIERAAAEGLVPSDAASAVDLLRVLSQGSLPIGSRASSDTLHVVAPKDAVGVSSDLLLLAGVDAEAWGMRSAELPWCDRDARFRLGLFDADRPLCRGRHALASMVASSSCTVVFDSTPEEAAGPSPPVAEWLLHLQRRGCTASIHAQTALLLEDDAGEDHGLWICQTDGSWSPRPSGYDKGRPVRAGQERRDARQRAGLVLEHGGASSVPVAVDALAAAAEASVLLDRVRRQPDRNDIGEDEQLQWGARERLQSTDRLQLRPSPSHLGKGTVSAAEPWPHLGVRLNKRSVSVSIDPRPLPPYRFAHEALDGRTGHEGPTVEREAWSPSRLHAWVTCPRQAWLEGVHGAGEDEAPSEDVDRREQGDLVHRFEESTLRSFGTWGADGLRTSEAAALPSEDPPALWQALVEVLLQDTPWLGRADAVAMHRRRSALGPCAFDDEGMLHPPARPTGELGRLMLADLALADAAPLASEWAVVDPEGNLPSVVLDESMEPVHLRCRIDRADEVLLPEGVLAEAHRAGLIPDHVERLVVLRDLKSLVGPKKGDDGKRHLQGLYDDVQLATYALAWEAARPTEMVVGVGITEVGSTTTHFVEIDGQVAAMLADLSIGEQSQHLHQTHPASTPDGTPCSPFRRWLYERQMTLARAVQAAQRGHVVPTPSGACRYCGVRAACPAAELGGGA